MSFILDALKKSESERQRQSGPALFEVKIAPPRTRIAVWGAAIAALLVINFVVVGIWLWRGGASRAAAPPAAAAPALAPASAPVQSGAPQAAYAPVPAGARFGARTEAGAAPPAAASTAPSTAASSAPPESPPAAARASAGDTGANPDDLAQAVEPHGTPGTSGTSGTPGAAVTGVVRATASGLPTYQDAAAEPGANIPSLSLDLHVYAPQADQRFVFLNMLKLREGDTSPQGVHVETITPDGVILSYQGKEFVLQRH